MKATIYTHRFRQLIVWSIFTFFSATTIFSTHTYAQNNTRFCDGFRTQNQRDWGERPRNNNSAGYLYKNFAAAFPDGITVGCDNKLKLTSAQAVTNLLPISGRISKLPNGTLVNPNNRRFNNPFAGQVIALKINMTFDEWDPNFGSNTILLKDLIIRRGPFVNKTVGEVMVLAEKALGGCPVSHSLYELNEIVTRINRNYMDGLMTGRYLTCPVQVVDPCANDTELPVITNCPTNLTLTSPDPTCFNAVWAEPMATDNCTAQPELTSTHFSGSCLPMGTTTVTYTAKDAKGNTSKCTFTVSLSYDPSLAIEALNLKGDRLEVEANAEMNRARLEWVSDMKVETDYFIIQKSMGNGEYTDVETVNGAFTQGLTYYTGYDSEPTEGDNTYRVVSVLIDGSVRISADKTVRFNNLNQVKVFPNPASEFVTIDLTNYEGNAVKIYLCNQLGNVIRTYNIEKCSGEAYSMEVSKLTTGSYFLRVSTLGKRDVTRQFNVIR